MIKLEDVYYGNLSGGQLDGYCAITIEFGDKRAVSLSLLVSTILKFARTKIVRVVGDLKYTPAEELASLLSILKENGYITIAVLDGATRQEWMNYVSFKVVRVTELPWLMFACNEIHFQPLNTDIIQPPFLADIHTKAACYLDVTSKMTATSIFDFLTKYPLWRIYSPPTKTYRMPIIIKDEE